MSEVNAALYDFLKENETGLYTQQFHKNKTVHAYVHMNYENVSDFVEVMGTEYFCEGGLEARIMTSSVCVEINDAIEYFGHSLSDYKNCFWEETWSQYADQIKEMET